MGFAHFERFFQSHFFPVLIRNTLLISVLSLVFSFPAPILFALMQTALNIDASEINLVLIVGVNRFAKSVTDHSLW